MLSKLSARSWAARVVFAWASLISAPAAADDWRWFQPAPEPELFELRVGGFAHDPFKKEKGSGDVNAEIVFRRLPIGPTGAWSFLVPKLHVGAVLNTADVTSYFYGGWTWTLDVNKWLFVESILGMAVHDGNTTENSPYREDFGCHQLFHVGGNVGARVTDRLSVMASWKHISNADTCRRNNGMDIYGVQVGWRF